MYICDDLNCVKSSKIKWWHRSILGHLWTQPIMVVGEIDFCSDDAVLKVQLLHF